LGLVRYRLADVPGEGVNGQGWNGRSRPKHFPRTSRAPPFPFTLISNILSDRALCPAACLPLFPDFLQAIPIHLGKCVYVLEISLTNGFLILFYADEPNSWQIKISFVRKSSFCHTSKFLKSMKKEFFTWQHIGF